MAEALKVEVRPAVGKRRNRRLRDAGKIPAVLYGHGQPTVNLQIGASDLSAVMRHGSRVVELQGGASESALIRDMQWDTYGLHILHVDFARVSADERIEVEVRVDLKGESVGQKDGGIIEHFIHSVQIECPALNIPDRLVVNISGLKIGQSLHVSDIPLPEGVKMLSDAGEMVVHCVTPADEKEGDSISGPAEPELIGRKPSDEDEEE